MLIQVDNETIRLGNYHFNYSGYLLNGMAPRSTNAAALKPVLIEWKRVLIENVGRECVLFLPFNFEDEWIECLRAKINGEEMSLTHTEVAENGWAVAMENLEGFITSSHEMVKESDVLFDRLNIRAFIEALSDALEPSQAS